MLMLGIPSFRLEKEVVNAEIEILREMGVKFQCGVKVGKDVTIAQLREQGYCGFYVAIGAQKSAAIRCPGETLTGVLGGVDFLRSVNLGEQPDVGKAVAVIGSGNVSIDVIDVARAALRLGAEKVCLVYRRSESELKADREEIEDALAEGMELKLLRAPAGTARSPRPALHVHGRAGQKGGVPLPWLRREHRRYQPLHRLRRVHDQMRV